MRGKSFLMALGTVLACLFLAAKPVVAHEVSDTERCAARMILAAHSLTNCVYRLYTNVIIKNPGAPCVYVEKATAFCMAKAVQRMKKAQERYGAACAAFTETELAGVAADIADASIRETRFLLTNSTCGG